ncbi:L,D-transpeptidase Cds6 family protein [Candidatus Entotheonella palauensis]|uniref:L,D-transpeptidase Cds6 family protein n=1 Tax=Candidatus Entotheonella palauensis TaxID=93172 RepID=UPI001178B037|nr:hypothetical protein [Candidatus Entotheonella palauensis]
MITRFLSPLLPLRAGRCASCKRRRIRVNGWLFFILFSIFLIVTFSNEIIESLKYLQQSEVSLADALARKAKLPTETAINTIKNNSLSPPIKSDLHRESIQDKVIRTPDQNPKLAAKNYEVKHQEARQLSNSLEKLKYNNEELSHDLVQRKKMLEAKDRQIAELSRRLDELKQQVSTASVDTGEQNTNDEAEINLVIQYIEQWRVAWQSQDTTAYISRYISDFQPSNGLSYQAWLKDRRLKIARPKTISLKILDLRLQRVDDKRWQAVFEQIYHSDTYRDVVTKKLVLIKVDDQYLIEKEQNL